MSRNNKIKTIFAVSGFALAFASALAELNHSTSGHLFLFLAAIFALIAIIIAISDFFATRRDESAKSNLSILLPASDQPTLAISPPPAAAQIEEPATIKETLPENTQKPLSPFEPSPIYGPPSPNEPAGKMIFSVGPPLWATYTQAKIHKVIWRWHYDFKFDDEPHGLIPHCPECKMPLNVGRPMGGAINPTINEKEYVAFLNCYCHPNPYVIPVDSFGGFTPTKKIIQQRIKDGSWEKDAYRGY